MSERDPAPASPATSLTVRGVLVTHGSMCLGMVDAVEKIAGSTSEALVAVSNDGRGPDDLLESVLRAGGSGPLLIFTDLHSGSCALAARLACAEPTGRRVICGVNLPMLLDFMFHRHLPLDELVDRLVQRGREAIRTFEPEAASRGDRPLPG